MNNQSSRNTIWWIVGIAVLAVLAIVIVILVMNSLGGGSGDAAGPEIEVTPPAEGSPSAQALAAVNLRSGPGTEYPSYGVAPQGATGAVVGASENRAWWVVSLSTAISPEGQGWVSGDFVQVSNAENVPVIPAPPPPPEVELPPPTEGAPTATALDYINIRSGPGLEYEIYGVGAKGAVGEVIGVSEDGDWWVIKLPTELVAGGQGWVSADWVTTENTENVPVIPAP